MKINDQELEQALDTMSWRGLKNAIIGLRHCDFNEPDWNELKKIEKYSEIIEYFFHIQRYLPTMKYKFKKYRELLREKDVKIKKLRRGPTEWGTMPKNFFMMTGGEK